MHQCHFSTSEGKGTPNCHIALKTCMCCERFFPLHIRCNVIFLMSSAHFQDERPKNNFIRTFIETSQRGRSHESGKMIVSFFEHTLYFIRNIVHKIHSALRLKILIQHVQGLSFLSVVLQENENFFWSFEARRFSFLQSSCPWTSWNLASVFRRRLSPKKNFRSKSDTHIISELFHEISETDTRCSRTQRGKMVEAMLPRAISKCTNASYLPWPQHRSTRPPFSLFLLYRSYIIRTIHPVSCCHQPKRGK